MALVQRAVAHDEEYVPGGENDDEHEPADHPGAGEGLGQAALHVLGAGELDGGAGHQLAAAEHLAVQRQRQLAEHRAGGDGGHQRLAVPLGVDDDVPLDGGEVRVVRHHGGDDVGRAQGHAVHALAQLHGGLRHLFGGADDLLHAEVVEHPVVEHDGVGKAPQIDPGAVRELHGRAAEDDGHQADAVLLRGGDEAVAGVVGVPGLDAVGVFVIIAAAVAGIGVDEGVGVGERALLADVGGRHGPGDGVADGGEEVVLERLGGDEREVCGRSVVVFIGQAMRVRKVRAGAAELGCALVHQLHEGPDRAGDMLGDDVAGLVGGGEHGAVEQVAEAHGLAGDDAGGAPVLHHALHGALAGRHLVVLRDLAALHGLHGQQHGHHLGEGGGIGPLVRVQRVIYAACLRVREQGGAGGYLGVVQRGGRGGQADGEQAEYQGYRQQREFSHINLRNSVLLYIWTARDGVSFPRGVHYPVDYTVDPAEKQQQSLAQAAQRGRKR